MKSFILREEFINSFLKRVARFINLQRFACVRLNTLKQRIPAFGFFEWTARAQSIVADLFSESAAMPPNCQLVFIKLLAFFFINNNREHLEFIEFTINCYQS